MHTYRHTHTQMHVYAYIFSHIQIINKDLEPPWRMAVKHADTSVYPVTQKAKAVRLLEPRSLGSARALTMSSWCIPSLTLNT